MWSIVDQIWASYEAHRNVELLRDDILTSPWYRRPQIADESLLSRAISARDVEAAAMLLSIGESPSIPADHGFNLLHEAVDQVWGSETSDDRGRSLTILSLLLEHGADPNVFGMDGTPLHRAAGAGCTDAVTVLLGHGADIELRMLVDGEPTPLIHSALMNQLEMVRFLIKSGARKDTLISRTLTEEATTLGKVLRYRGTPVAKEILHILEHTTLSECD